MLEQFRLWLYKKYLPKITLDKYLKEREDLKRICKKQQETIEKLEAYINGMQDGLRRTTIKINNVVGGSDDRFDSEL